MAAVSASDLSTDEFTFGEIVAFYDIVVYGVSDDGLIILFLFFFTVGFLSKHSGSRKERLMVSASEATTQIFYVPPHKSNQFLEETSSLFGVTRYMFNFSSATTHVKTLNFPLT